MNIQDKKYIADNASPRCSGWMQRACRGHAFLTSGEIVPHESGETEALRFLRGSEASGNLVSGEIEEETTEDVTELNLAGDGREENGGSVTSQRLM